MEEIEYKLNSRNPILISHAVSKTLDSIANKTEDFSVNQQDLSRSTKVNFLLSKCQSEDTVVSTTALTAFVTLVETGVLGVSSALSSLISSLVATKNLPAFITAINSLLIFDLKIRITQGSYVCPFELNSLQHPFITILNQDKQVWKDVFSQMRFDINHHQPEIFSHSEQLLGPVFLHILLHPNSNLPEACRQQTWNLLMKSELTNLKIQVLQWLRSRDFSSLIDTNYRLLELAEMMILMNEENFSSALMPIIASYGIQILKRGRDPRPNLDIINEIGKKSNCGFCLTIAILSSAIAQCPVIYLYSLLETCEYLLDKGSCSSLVANGLLSSLIQWQAYPAFLSLDALKIAKNLIDKILSPNRWNCDTRLFLGNEIFVKLINSFPDIQFYTQLCNIKFLCEKEILSWLQSVSQSPRNLQLNLKHFLLSLFLETQDSQITTSLCDILLKISDLNLVASQMLPLVLYKLTNSHSSEQAVNLLFTIPELATTNENFPIIINTFETFLNSGKPLKYLAVDLYYRAWKKEARLHSFLMKILISAGRKNLNETERCEEFNSVLVQAKIMKEMCEIRPENAAELVPLLSEILNRRTNHQGTPANALALKGISALCKSGVIDIISTWKALAPKFEKENRPVVLQALCEFISEIPTLTSLEEDHCAYLLEKLLSKLWNLVLYSEDIRVPKAAFTALKSYSFQFLSKKVLPPSFGSINLNLIEDLQTNLNSGEIPGTYWIHMLENLNPKLLSTAGDLLMIYVEEETKFLPQIRGEAASYKALSPKSIIKAIGQTLMDCQSYYNNQQRLIITELLRIFAKKYSKPLPTVKYGFLEKCKFSKETREHCFNIICNQAEVSPSARKILEEYLTNSTHQQIDLIEILPFYSNLESICRGASPYILHNFLQVSLNFMAQKSHSDNKNYSAGFKEAMDFIQSTLKHKTLPEISRGVIVDVLETLFETVNNDSIFSSYLLAILEIPREDLLRITSGEWEKINVSRLKKAMLIRTEWALKQNEDQCWEWINEIFQGCESRSETYEYVLRTIQRIQIEKRLQKFNWSGILATMDRIQSKILNFNFEKNSESEVDFLCDALLTSVCFLSGIDSLEKNRESLIKSKHIRIRLFPLGLLYLVKHSDSRETIPKIMMWLHCLRTTNAVSPSYKQAFHNALISLKNEKYFESAWMTFLSTKTNFESTL